ncbi:hypothetical protein JCM8097_001431 [Rhodosporidiobolus ruineniae]
MPYMNPSQSDSSTNQGAPSAPRGHTLTQDRRRLPRPPPELLGGTSAPQATPAGSPPRPHHLDLDRLRAVEDRDRLSSSSSSEEGDPLERVRRHLERAHLDPHARHDPYSSSELDGDARSSSSDGYGYEDERRTPRQRDRPLRGQDYDYGGGDSSLSRSPCPPRRPRRPSDAPPLFDGPPLRFSREATEHARYSEGRGEQAPTQGRYTSPPAPPFVPSSSEEDVSGSGGEGRRAGEMRSLGRKSAALAAEGGLRRAMIYGRGF